MTYWGTNTYLLGWDSVAVIDPGPMNDAHFSALRRAINGRRVSHILVTHSHLDHSPLARSLADLTGASVLAFGDSTAGRSDIMQTLANSGEMGGGEGVDTAFYPDETLSSGDTVAGDGWSVRALHTPGHFGNHLSFIWNDAAFCGDHLMGWASSLVSPPDGDLTDFMASCDALLASGITRAYSGHGAPIMDARARLTEIMAHRRARDSQIMTALQSGPSDAKSLTARLYTDVAPTLHTMAQRNVLAHLIDLTQRGIAAPETSISPDTTFALTSG